MSRIRLLIIITICFFLAESGFAQEALKITFLDVGEGEAIFIQAADKNVLIDAGTLLTGYKLVEYFVNNDIKKLDYLIITHPDPDHMGGVFFILPKFKVNTIFDNAQDLTDKDIYRCYQKLVRSKENYRVLKAGDILEIEAVFLEVLWPDKPNITDSFNANSLVIMLKYRDFRCLFTGDLNNIGEKKLLEGNADLRANVLKAGHHGYLDATSEEFLDAVLPEYAVISTDPETKMGTPSEPTINRLHNKGVRIYRTDEHGNIVIAVKKNGKSTIKTER